MELGTQATTMSSHLDSSTVFKGWSTLPPSAVPLTDMCTLVVVGRTTFVHAKWRQRRTCRADEGEEVESKDKKGLDQGANERSMNTDREKVKRTLHEQKMALERKKRSNKLCIGLYIQNHHIAESRRAYSMKGEGFLTNASAIQTSR